MVVWVHEYMCCICVVLYEIVSVLYVCVWLYWRYVVMWCYDLSVIYTCVICRFWALHGWNFLYVVLNTTCNCIRYYVMWILVLYYVVMCVYVDNYVDNFNINVDNFLLHLQHFYELFWKYCIFVCFRTLSLVISYLLLFSHFFIIS